MPMPVGVPHYLQFSRDGVSNLMPLEKIEEDIGDRIGFLRCRVTLSPEVVAKNPLLSAHPLLPMRTEERIVHPIGSWFGTYATTELKLAHSLGYEIEVDSGYLFESDNSLFHDFISKFYNMRQEAKRQRNGAVDQVAKLIMNSAYGRFALSTEPGIISLDLEEEEMKEVLQWFNVIEVHRKEDGVYHATIALSMDQLSASSLREMEEGLDGEGSTMEQTGDILSKRLSQTIQDAKQDDFKVERNVGIAAIITSYARCLLYSYLAANPAVTYMDTDSVM